MKKIFFLFAAVMSLLAVSCRDVLLEKNTGGFSVSFQTPGSGSRSGTTATWKLEAWLELESGAQLQKKDDTVPANAPITITFDAVPIGTKLKVQVRLEDSENSLIQHEGSSDWITVDAESKTVAVQVQRKVVNAAAPTIITQPQSQPKEYQVGDEVSWKVTLTVAATSEDGGELSYQWFESSSDTTDGGEKLAEATKQSHEETLTPGETKYFYCVVTNTNDAVNGTKTATTTSSVAKIVYYIAQSGVLLWNYDTSTSSNNYKIVPYGAYNGTGVSLNESSSSLAWCFDNTGNLYWYAEGENGAQCYNLQSDESYISSGVYYSSPPFSALSYDNSANILYGIGDGGALKYWQKTGGVSHDILLDGGTGLFSISDSLGFTVHNNIVYCATYAEVQEDNGPILGVVQLSSYKLEDASDGGSKTATSLLVDKKFTLPEVFGSNPPTCQMIYQDGALYLLLRRLEINDASADNPVEHYSLGALAKIDPNTLTLDTSFGIGGYLGLSSSPVTFNDRKDNGKTFNVTYHGSTAGNDTFFGPVGFVAVMPKKLVIGDAGFAMSADGADTTVSLTKKSRVVTVNLETLAFDATDIDTSYYQSDDNYSSISDMVTGYSYIVIANN